MEPALYTCGPCNYSTIRKHDYDKHITTQKHRKKVSKELPSVSLVNDSVVCFSCDLCSKVYKHSKSLSRHKKEVHQQNVTTNNDVYKKLEENANRTEQLFKKLTDLNSEPKIINNTINNTMINKQININLFLDSEYKDAISLREFKEQLKLSLDDLLYTKNNGYVKGVTNILIKNLEELGPEKRPIHCGEKTDHFYIKDNNSWVEDKNNCNIDNTINNVVEAQIKKIKEWEQDNPDWEKTQSGQKEYIDIIKSVMGSCDAKQQERYNLTIKKGIKKNIEIDLPEIQTLQEVTD